MKSNPRLKKLILEIVDKQLKENDPPETTQTLERLMKEGYTAKQAKEFIACIVSTEIYYVLKNKEVFNPKRFIEALNNLPKLPWD